jgi:hypothetical protein
MTLSPEVYQLMYIKDAGQNGGIACSPIPAAVLHVNERDRAWGDAMYTPQPFATMTEAIHLQGRHLEIKKKAFVLASAWEPNPFRQFYERLRGDPAWATRAIESGHDRCLTA